MTPNSTRLVLFVCQNKARVHQFGVAAGRANWRVIHATHAEQAIAMLGTHDGMALDAVLTVQTAPETLVREIVARRAALPVLLETDTNEAGLQAMRLGATDYLLKPTTAERLLAALEAALATSTLCELRPLSERSAPQLSFAEIVGSDPTFRAALALAAKGARARAPMLIEGAAGVGKSLVAGAVHAASPRDKKPFMIVNVAHGAPTLIESEIFGHEKGAFPGAFDRLIGKAALADGGTLLIKNVDQLGPDLQLKLLRLIEHGEIRPFGRAGAQLVDIRVIATSLTPLHDAAHAGRFREDLYYRLATVHVTLPSLRARHGDVPMLVRHLLARQTANVTSTTIGITDAALEILGAYHWPGNVAQLQSTLLRATIGQPGETLTVTDFPVLNAQAQLSPRLASVAVNPSGVTMFLPDGHLRPLTEIEADIIRLAIGHYRGRMSEVARRLGIGRSTLYRKLIELGLTDAA